jgi:hypothetical protein
MELDLARGQPTAKSIPGELFVGGVHAAYTLERPEVAIPAGKYQITLYPSPHFHRLMPLLNDVPGRADILIHWGNFPENSDGCLLVGETRDLSTDEIFNTRRQFDALFPAIQAAVENEGCFIIIHG